MLEAVVKVGKVFKWANGFEDYLVFIVYRWTMVYQVLIFVYFF
jgi:hypothetical protein